MTINEPYVNESMRLRPTKPHPGDAGVVLTFWGVLQTLSLKNTTKRLNWELLGVAQLLWVGRGCPLKGVCWKCFQKHKTPTNIEMGGLCRFAAELNPPGGLYIWGAL